MKWFGARTDSDAIFLAVVRLKYKHFESDLQSIFIVSAASSYNFSSNQGDRGIYENLEGNLWY